MRSKTCFAFLVLCVACGGAQPEPATAEDTVTEAFDAPSDGPQETLEPHHDHPPESADHGQHGHGDEHGGNEGSFGDPHRGHHFADPQRFVAAWNDPARDEWQKPDEIVAAAELGDGDVVVDLGAGTGYLVPHLATAVGDSGTVIAADVEQAMLTFLDETAVENGWTNVQTHLSAYDDPALEPASVDAIVTLNVWHHVSDRTAYAERALAALKPGGVFAIVDFLDEETEGFGPPLRMRLSEEEVVEELTAAGFEVEVVEETMPRHYVVRGRRPAE